MEEDARNAAGEKRMDPSSAMTTPTSSASPAANEALPLAAKMPATPPSSAPPLGTGTLPPTPANQPESRFASWIPRWPDVIPITILLALAIVLVELSNVLFKRIYPLPYPTRMYLSLSAGAAILIFAGLFFLIILIPAASKFLKSELRTELFSVRASSLCVIAGLVIFGIVAIGLVSDELIQTLRRH